MTKTFKLLLGLLMFSLFSCGGDDDCEIRDIIVETGACSCEDTYELTLDFEYIDAPDDMYALYTRNNNLVGYYKLAALPLTLDKFETSGLEYDYIKICLDDTAECCKEYEFMPPDCEPEGDCKVFDLTVEVGDCLNDEEYKIFLDFEYTDAGNEYFDLFLRNNELFGYYELKDLPTIISNFPISGEDYDYLKVCINDNPDCCKELEFMAPDCDEGCEIFDLVVEAGDCTSENAYNLFVDFEYTNPSHTNFELFVRNNVRKGNYPLSDLPLKIEDFELSGNDYDYIKVCMSDDPDCCKAIEFMPPDCSDEGCEIFDLVVEAGECTSENTYNLFVDFEYSNPSHSNFELFVRNNVRIGNYPLTDLPLKVEDFELSGKDYDYIKVCMSDDPDCCKEIEFMPPECNGEGECEITDFNVEIGPCTSDSTYTIVIDFEYENADNEFFDLFIRNDVHLDFFSLDQLPVTIENFEMSGKDYDFLKVCINDNPDCCKAAEFMPPDC